MPKILLCLSVLLFIGIGCTPTSSEDFGKKEDEDSNKEKKKEEAIPVRVLEIKAGKISNFVEASSIVEAKFRVDVHPKIAGEVLKVYKEEGMTVKKGELLAELDHEELKLDLAESRLLEEELKHQLELQKVALLESIQKQKSDGFQIKELDARYEDAKIKAKKTDKDFARSQKMLKKNLISEDDFEATRLADQNAQFDLKMANLSLEKAEFDLDTLQLVVDKAKIEIEILKNKIKKAELAYKKVELNCKETNIVAPISGIISFAEIQVGQNVQLADKAFSIIDSNKLEIKIGVPERDLLVIQKDQPVLIFNETMPLKENTSPQGIIHAISPIVQEETGTIKITIRILSEFVSAFKAGMFVTVHIISDTHNNAVLVPKKALLFDDNVPFVFLLDEKSRAKKVFLKKEMIGFKDKFHYEILDRIKSGDSIIVVGQSGLKDETLVRVVKETTKS